MNSITLNTKIGKFNFMVYHDKRETFSWLDVMIKDGNARMYFTGVGIINKKILDYISKSYEYSLSQKAIFETRKKFICVKHAIFTSYPCSISNDDFNLCFLSSSENFNFRYIQRGDIVL